MNDNAGTLFVTECSEVSGRTAEICDEVDSVWLYLTEPGVKKIADEEFRADFGDSLTDPNA